MASLLVLVCGPLLAGEIWVDGSAAPGGDGSADRPFVQIAQGVKAAAPGDTVTLRQGVYRERITLNNSGLADRPTVLRGAPSERVVISGFVPITRWEPAGDVAEGVYSTMVEGSVSALYVGYVPQPVARWPDEGEAMRPLLPVNAATGVFRDPALPAAEPFIQAVAQSPGRAMAFVYNAQPNLYSSLPIETLEPASGTLRLGASKALASMGGKGSRGDQWALVNHKSLIRRAGQWATEPAEGGRSRLYFRPQRAEDLEKTQHPGAGGPLLVVARHGSPVSQLVVEGLEVCGSGGGGIEVRNATEIVVRNCLLHNNAGNGLWFRRCKDIQVSNVVSVANGSGVAIVSTQGGVLENSEIAFNAIDGVVVAGNISGKEGGEPFTRDITLRRNYIHHHQFLAHPDNLQTYRGVSKLTIEDCLLLYGGQGIMTEETDGATLRNSIVVGTSAYAIILGHGNSNGWTFERITVNGGLGAFNFTGKDYRLHNSVLWNNALPMVPALGSNNNRFLLSRNDMPMAVVAKPKYTKLMTPLDVGEATGQDIHSKRISPDFLHAPAVMVTAGGDPAGRTDRLLLNTRVNSSAFAPGDQIEVNGDGVLRRITQMLENRVEFTPPLPMRPFRGCLVANWKDARDTTLDLRRKDPSAGATLDIAAYQRGDFSGTGRREIPEIPPEVQAGLPTPNERRLPLLGR